LKKFDDFIDTQYPKGWRWLGRVTGIAILATLAAYVATFVVAPFDAALSQVFDTTASLVRTLTTLMIVLSALVICYFRGSRAMALVFTVIFLVILLTSIVRWSHQLS